MPRPALLLIAAVCALPLPCAAASGPTVVPISPCPAPTGTICDAGGTQIFITVKDERRFPALIGGRISPDNDAKPLVLVTRGPGEMTEAFRSSGEEVLRVLGFIPAKPGTGTRLDLTIKEFVIFMDSLKGSDTCTSYAAIEARLTSPDGTELARKSLKIAHFDRTFTMLSIKEVARQAASRLIAITAWEATASPLTVQFHPAPNAAWVAREAAALRTMKDTIKARHIIHWFALAGLKEPPVGDDLLAQMRFSKSDLLREAAAEAAAMLGIPGASKDLEGILAGAGKFPQWKLNDFDQLWYVVHSLALLGNRSPGPLPEGLSEARKAKLADLLKFQTTGAVPPIGAAALLVLTE